MINAILDSSLPMVARSQPILLTVSPQKWYIRVSMKCFSTAQAAKMLGIQRTYLQALIKERRIKAPKLQRFGGVSARLWTLRDVENARKALNRDKK
jgi:excisionase family DNA binding protein